MRRLLLVDDEEGGFPDDFAQNLHGKGYEVVHARSRIEGQGKWMEHDDIRIALVDLKMPENKNEHPIEQSGAFLIQFIEKYSRENKRPHAVAAVTGLKAHEDLARAVEAGAIGWISKEHDFEPHQLSTIRLCEASLVEPILLNMVELRNPYTQGHCIRTAEYCRLLIQKLTSANGMNFNLAACLMAARVHDLGKVGQPDKILLGIEALSPDERQVVGRHSQVGADRLVEIDPLFKTLAEIVLYHHVHFKKPGNGPKEEKGSDYPAYDLSGKQMKRGKKIPIEARVLSVADNLDALLSDRSYGSALPVAKVRKYIVEGAGTKFCPEVVDALAVISNEQLLQVQRDYRGSISDDWALEVTFNDRRMTPGRLGGMLNMMLPDGAALHRVALKEIVDRRGDSGQRFVEITLTGEREELQEIKRILDERKKAEDKDTSRLRKSLREVGEPRQRSAEKT